MAKEYIGSYTLQDFNDTTFSAEYSLTGLDGSWHTSFQNGDLFMRTKTGESSWSQAIRIVGEDGATGQSVVSITPQYYSSTSNSSQQGGSWSNTMPTWVSGKYLWTREEVEWENPTNTTTTTPILAEALNSANQAATTAQVAATAAQTTATAAQTAANGKNAIYYQESEPIGGTYKTNDVWFDTSNDNKMYRRSGTDWIAALFGVGAIGSTIIENGFIATPLLNASNIQTGTLDASVVTVSNLDAGKIITGELDAEKVDIINLTAETIQSGTIDAEKVNIINLSAGSIFVGGTTSVQDKINEFDAIEIGGRNLIPSSVVGQEGYTTKEFELMAWATQLISEEDTLNILESGKEYTISYDMELTETTDVPTLYALQAGLLLYSPGGNGNVPFSTYVLVNKGDKHRYVQTFTAPQLVDHRFLIYSNRYTTNGDEPFGFDTLKVTNLKLEKGNIATDWTPAPEDVAAEIATRTAEVQETARIAAEDYANAQKALTDATAKAYADNNLTLAEQKAIAEAAAALSTANQNLATAKSALETFVLQHVSDETAEIKSYIRSNASGNLEIGSLSGVSKLVQSPTAMTFMVGTIPVATFGSGETDMPKAGVDTELRIGDKTSNYHWVSDPDGGMSLIWK